MVSIELDRARRRFHEAQNNLRNARAFIERWDGDDDKAKSLGIMRATLPARERAFAEAQAALAPLEAAQKESYTAAPVTVAFTFRERTTPLTEEEIAAYPDLPEFLRRTS